MENVNWIQTLLKQKTMAVAETVTMAERISVERKTTIANEFEF